MHQTEDGKFILTCYNTLLFLLDGPSFQLSCFMSQNIFLSSRAHLDATIKKHKRCKDQKIRIKWSLEVNCAMERNLANSLAAISSGRILEALLPMNAQRKSLLPWCGLASSTWAWAVVWNQTSKQCLSHPLQCPLSSSLNKVNKGSKLRPH